MLIRRIGWRWYLFLRNSVWCIGRDGISKPNWQWTPGEVERMKEYKKDKPPITYNRIEKG